VVGATTEREDSKRAGGQWSDNDEHQTNISIGVSNIINEPLVSCRPVCKPYPMRASSPLIMFCSVHRNKGSSNTHSGRSGEITPSANPKIRACKNKEASVNHEESPVSRCGTMGVDMLGVFDPLAMVRRATLCREGWWRLMMTRLKSMESENVGIKCNASSGLSGGESNEEKGAG